MAKHIKPPSKDMKVGKQYTYLNIPKDMDSCYYDLELVEFREIDTGDKLVAVFAVIETDTKVRPGEQVSHLLDPYQKFAETYFWREIFGMYTALKGREMNQKRLDKLTENHEMPLQALRDGELNGMRAHIKYRRFEKPDPKDDTKVISKTSSTWSPYTGEAE